MGKHTVNTYKMRVIKRKWLGVRYVHTSTSSIKGIPSGETNNKKKNSWETRRPPPRGVNGHNKAYMIATDQGLTENSVSAHHIIESQLNLNNENWYVHLYVS